MRHATSLLRSCFLARASYCAVLSIPFVFFLLSPPSTAFASFDPNLDVSFVELPFYEADEGKAEKGGTENAAVSSHPSALFAAGSLLILDWDDTLLSWSFLHSKGLRLDIPVPDAFEIA